MEKERALLEISSTANSSCEQLKDLQLQMQSLIFQDATPERLNSIKKIVDEIESQTLKFQKMNVELNYVHNCYIEGIMPANATTRDHEIIAALPRYKRYQRKLAMFCDEVEMRLTSCDLFKRRSAFQKVTATPMSVCGGKAAAPLDMPTLLGRDKGSAQLASSVVAQSAAGTTIVVKVDDCMNCLLRYEAGEVARVLVKGPTESFCGEGGGGAANAGAQCGPEASIDSRFKIDYFSPSKLRLFREITHEAVAFLAHVRATTSVSAVASSRSSGTGSPSSAMLQQHQRMMEWLNSFCGLHSLQCCVCGRILGKHHLPPIRRDVADLSRVMHDYC